MPACRTLLVAAILAAAGTTLADDAVMVREWNMQVLRCRMPTDEVRFVGSSAPGQIFYADEPVHVSLVFKKGTASGTVGDPAVEIQGIHTRVPDKYTEAYVDPFGHPDRVTLDGKPVVHPIEVTFGDEAEARVEVRDLPVPTRFGTYALVLVRGQERRFLATLARVPKPRPDGTVDDTPILGEGALLSDRSRLENRAACLQRMGIRGIRVESGWSEDRDGTYRWDQWDPLFTAMERHGVKLLVTLGGMTNHWMSFGQPVPAAVKPDWDGSPYWGQADWLCDPSLYPRYGKWIEAFCRRYWKDGRGALWGIEHYNEPWEGGGISGWARDCREYRTLLKLIATNAKRVSPDIRILAASSIMNTEDKLYSEGPGPDGTYEMDAYIDVFTDHYVRPPMCYGQMVAAAHGKQSMETETWLVISEYLLAPSMARWLASGQNRLAPWHPRVLFDPLPGTKDDYFVPTTVVVATAAFNHFVTGRPFQRVVFREHLPWLFQFGRDDDPDALLILFGQLISAGADSPAKEARNRPWAQVDGASGGTMTIDNRDGLLEFYDLAGNPVADSRKTLTLPMTYLPTYIKCRNGPAAAAERIRQARIEGKRPVEILPRDFAERLGPGATLEVAVHNGLNRAIRGRLVVRPPDGIALKAADAAVALGAGRSATLRFTVASATPVESNNYPFSFRFTSDSGTAEYAEVLSVCVAPKRSPTIDGRLDEWRDVPGITLAAADEKIDITERARRPWLEWKNKAPDGTFAEVKMAWDERFLYLAARVHDPTPQTDHERLETRDEEAYFHSKASDGREPYKSWLAKNAPGRSLAEVPYVYARNPTLPDSNAWGGDRLHVGLDVRDDWHGFAPTTDRVPLGFHAVPDTDYEYAVYRCKDAGSELWRLLAPGVPRIHDWPRQPRGKRTTGPVGGTKHAVRQEGNVRLYECAIPRDEVPDLALRAGTRFGFTFMIGNDQGPSVVYGADKAVTRTNGLTLHPYWWTSPSCGVRWALVE